MPLLLLTLIAGSHVEASPDQGQGAYALAETWPMPEDRRPSDAWARMAGLETLPDGGLLIADADPSLPRITRVAPDGSVSVLIEGLAMCEPARAPIDALCSPQHLAADAGRDRIYVVDGARDALLVYTMAGVWLRSQIGIDGAQGVAVSANGTVHVSSASSGQIHRFDADGGVLETWQVLDPQPGASLLGGMDIDADGNVYVIDTRAARLLKLNAIGKLASVHEGFAGSARLLDVAVMAVPNRPSLRAFWLATNQGLMYSEERTSLGALNAVGTLSAVALGPGDRLFAAWTGFSAALSELLVFDSRTARTATPERVGALPHPLGLNRGPDRITMGLDDALLVLDRTLRVQRLRSDGTPIGQWLDGDLIDVGAAADGRIYGTDGASLARFAAPGTGLHLTERARWPSGAAGFLSNLALTPSGTVLGLDIGRRQLRRFDSASGAESAPVQLSPADAPSHWSDLAVDASGFAWVLDRRSGEVTIVDAESGTVTRTLALGRAAQRLGLRPDGEPLLLDASGRIWHFAATGSLRGVFDASRRDLDPSSRPIDLAVLSDDSVLVIDRAAGSVSRWAWDPTAQPERPDLGQECVYSHDKLALPETVVLGQPVEIRLLAEGECAQRRLPALDVMLVLDASGSMAGERIRLVQQAALDFTRALDLNRSRVGLVSFSQSAQLVSPLTDDESDLWRSLRGLRPFGASRIDLGLELAFDTWQASRRPGVGTIFILLSDGRSEAAPALAAADRIKQAGVELFTVGTSTLAEDRALIEAIASSPDHSYVSEEPTFLFDVLDAIARRVAATRLFERAIVRDEIPANMRFVPGSAVPAASWDPSSRILEWQLADVPFAGFDLRFSVEPQATGDWPTNVQAVADLIDGFGQPDRITFPVPRVQVIAPTPTPSPSPTATPTPEPAALYLPLLLHEICVPEQRSTDAVLVLDVSSSMRGAKLTAAKEAAKAFVDLMQPARDRVALVAFDHEARLASPLGSDLTALRAAIDALGTRQGTAIDQGLAAAYDELRSSRRRPDATPALILLTDGQQPDGQSAILDLGGRMCEAGVQVYAIGLGDAEAVDFQLLRRLACRPAMAFLAPQVGDLRRIYESIAAEIPCDAGLFWGRR
ncbi:MAG: VWA domain-containing protein [Caldilineae bacterium]|nr:VWA domain-containing protein [Caldilineae bacterium]